MDDGYTFQTDIAHSCTFSSTQAIVITFTHNMNFKSVRTMVNGEQRMQHCKSSHLSERGQHPPPAEIHSAQCLRCNARIATTSKEL